MYGPNFGGVSCKLLDGHGPGDQTYAASYVAGNVGYHYANSSDQNSLCALLLININNEVKLITVFSH